MKWKLAALASVMVATVLAGTGQRLPACAGEDGGPYPCLWDGPTRGNGNGDRVIIPADD
jgi:hypothetical protein